MAQLTPTAISRLNNGETVVKPVVQVVDIKQIGNAASAQERYRLVISDGTHFQQAMLATQLNELVKEKKVEKSSILRLGEYICNMVQNRKIIIVLNMEVLETTAPLIGCPEPLPMGESLPPGGPSGVQPAVAPPVAVGQSAPPQQPPINLYHPSPASAAPQGYAAAASRPSMYSNGTLGDGVGSGPQVPASGGGYSSGPTAYGPGAGGSGYGGRSAGPGAATVASAGIKRPFEAGGTAPAPVYSNKGPVARNQAPARIVPISQLNPYQNKWTIVARVTSKGGLRRYNNARGDGKVFHVDLLDEQGGEIRATFFNKDADRFYSILDAGKVYMISGGSLKPAKKDFNPLRNDYELFGDSNTQIDLCQDDGQKIPQQVFNFKSVAEIEEAAGNAIVDVLGVVESVLPATTIQRKNGTDTEKRSLTLRDHSNRAVELTLWGAFCHAEGQRLQELRNAGQSPILAVKQARISDFNGKSVGTISSSQLLIDPDIAEAHRLRKWFDDGGKGQAVQSISREAGAGGGRGDVRKNVVQIREEGLGRGEKPDWIALRATVAFIRHESAFYAACPLKVGERACNKKLAGNAGAWYCERCGRGDITTCDYRFLLNMEIKDHSGREYLTAFQECGEEVMGCKAEQLQQLKEESGGEGSQPYRQAFQQCCFAQYLFKVKVKEEEFNDERRVKCTVVKLDKLDFVAESRLLLAQIARLKRGEPMHGVAAAPAPAAAAPPVDASAPIAQTYAGPGATFPTSNAGYPSSAAGRGYARDGASTGAGGGACFKCGGSGHWARDCPNGGGGRGGGVGRGNGVAAGGTYGGSRGNGFGY